MLFPHVVNTEADKVFVNVLNVQVVTVDAGDVIGWDTGTSDGVRTTQLVTGTRSLFVGIADSSIAASAYGLAQAYGYRAAALVIQDTSVTGVVGDIFIPVTAVDYSIFSANSDGKSGFLYLAESLATATTVTAVSIKMFIRAL